MLLTSHRLLAVDLTGTTQAQPNSSNGSSATGAALRATISLLLKCTMETSEKWDLWRKRVPALPSPAQTPFWGRVAATCHFVHCFSQPFKRWTPLLPLFLQVYRKTQILWCSSDTIGKIKVVQWLIVSERLSYLHSQNQSGTVSVKDQWTVK